MKTTKQGIISMVAQLAEIIELRKAQEKIEKEIKGVLKEFMGNDSILEAGDFLVLVESRNRSDLDRKALTIELGTEVIEKFTKHSTYEILSIKPVVRS